MTATAQTTYRVQAAGTDPDDVAEALRLVARQLDEGHTSGFLADTYDYERVAPDSDAQVLYRNAAVHVMADISETTPEHVAFTLDVIAMQIADGFQSGMDSHDEGTYSFTVTQRRR